jgi:hypothetical protein
MMNYATRPGHLKRQSRCGARTRAGGAHVSGRPIRGRKRCRLHGGLSPGAPRGPEKPVFYFDGKFSDADFQPLVRPRWRPAAVTASSRALEVADFNADAGTVMIRQSKSGKPRHVALTDAAAAFFRQHCAGRTGLVFTRADGAGWKKSEQAKPKDGQYAASRFGEAGGRVFKSRRQLNEA